MKVLLAFLLAASLQVADDTAVHGTVRDRKTGQPIPSYALRLRTETEELEEGELVWTDEQGRFTSRRRYAGGERVQITKLDHPGLARVSREPLSSATQVERASTFFRLDPGELPLKLSATVGPTYRLELTPPPDAEHPVSGASLRAEGELLGTILLAPLRAPSADVEGKARTWVRFPSVRNDLPADAPWLLRVESEDGLRAGAVVVPRIPPDEPVEIRLVPTARLDVLVRVTAGPYYLSAQIILIESVETGVREPLLHPVQVSNIDGKIEARSRSGALAPGDYRVLAVGSDGKLARRANVTLVGGEAQSCEIEIE